MGVDHRSLTSPTPMIFSSSRQEHPRPLRPSYTREGVGVEPYAIHIAGCDSGAAITADHSHSPTVRAAFHGPLGMSSISCDVSHRVPLRRPYILFLGSEECRLQPQICNLAYSSTNRAMKTTAAGSPGTPARRRAGERVDAGGCWAVWPLAQFLRRLPNPLKTGDF